MSNELVEPEFDLRAGNVARAVWSRTVDGRCTECEKAFNSTGPAASHARSARHNVTVNYSTTFAYVPLKGVAP